MKVIIIGGVAGGASCAARLRRLDENAEIIMVERGPYVSYANCGLPYHVGGVIPEESKLLVASEELFRTQFAVDARTRCEAISISPVEKTVNLKNLETGEVSTESYDKLVLSPGAPSIRPPLPGIDLPGVFEVRTVPDAAQLLGIPDRPPEDPRRGCGWRIHRPRDGGEPRPSRLRCDGHRDGPAGARADRPGYGARC
jgi:NADPH-dependent 2,4-dienoyl-CoA reductase/sulfur reductase-like enzyme